MNYNIINAFVIGSLALGMASCDENSWNDHYLDGFVGGADYENSESGTYTLTESDYSAISKLMQAEAKTEEEKTVAKAIGTNLFFDKNSVFTAPEAIPFFLDSSSFPYFLTSNGSSFDITFQEAGAVPEELSALAGAKTYTVTNEDYATVWGSQSAFIKSFAPDASASAKLPSVLSKAFSGDNAVESGTYAVVTYNNATQNPMFGMPDEAPITADLFSDNTFKAGKYVIGTGGVVANIIDPTMADGKYSYLYTTEVTANGDGISGIDLETNVFVFTDAGTPGQYYLGDDLGHFYYGAVKYNNLYIASSYDSDNDLYKWTVTKNDDGTWTITNIGSSKWLQYDSGYGNWGTFNTAKGPLPVLYTPGEAVEPVEIPLYTPASTTENAVYFYNGSKWSVAEGVSVLNPSDYTSMGFSNNSLSDPELYIPTYLKNKLPYAQNGDQEYVVFNGTTTNLYVYDGTAWILNENGLETVTGRFIKKDNKWSFVKYIGKAIFTDFDQEQIELDRRYLLVSGNVCGTLIDKNLSFSYFYTTPISISGGQYIAPNDANAILFATSCEIDGTVIKAPEGKFMMQDANERYIYLDATHSSAQLSNGPAIDGGEISSSYLWSAKRNDDGTWAISCDSNGKKWFYSTKYGNFAAYQYQSDVDVFPSLMILSE